MVCVRLDLDSVYFLGFALDESLFVAEIGLARRVELEFRFHHFCAWIPDKLHWCCGSCCVEVSVESLFICVYWRKSSSILVIRSPFECKASQERGKNCVNYLTRSVVCLVVLWTG